MSKKTFGDSIKEEREKLNWDQLFLAKKLGKTQQTVSRWELNETTPKASDVIRLAELFSVDKNEWLNLSGRSISHSIDNSLDPYLPFEELSPEKFELFCKYLIKSISPTSDVHLYGKQGHKQHGIDIVAENNGKTAAYQCKRHKQFGKKKVLELVNKTEFIADHYFILLSRVASPEARDVIRKKNNWTLWDRVDLSQEIRRLRDFGEQVRIVNIFFPHKLKSFLGVDEPAPWSSPEDFFATLQNKSLLFTHAWDIVGRNDELNKVVDFIENDEEKVLVVTGRGGIGKSRFLKAWSDKKKDSFTIKFLANNTEVRLEHFNQFPQNAILVIDDAHERDDLFFILDWLNKNRPHTKIIISSRPYALTEIKDSLSRSGIYFNSDNVIELNPLTKQQTVSLATEVLSESPFASDKVIIERLAEITKDCPLATVVGSKLVATEKVLPDLLSNESKFTDELFSKFKDVLSGQIPGSNSQDISLLLEFISIVQPFNPTSTVFKESISKILGRPYFHISKDLSALESAGVLLNRNNQIRIVPDLLADQIRLDASIDKLSGEPSQFVDAIYDVVSDDLSVNLVLNISRLDWRLSADEIKSSLLDSIWNRITQEVKGNSNRTRINILKNLKDSAYYQPEKFLSLAKFIVDNPNERSDEQSISGMFRFSHQDVLNELPGILRRVCYSEEYFDEAVDLIWKISRGDSRRTNQYPDHGLRVLQDIAQYDLYELTKKSITVNKSMLEAVKRWGSDEKLENYIHSPLDILDELLDKDSTTDEYQSGKIIFHSFAVHYENTKELRDGALSVVKEYIQSPKLKLKLRAVKSLQHALSEPRGLYNRQVHIEEKRKWVSFQLEVLKIIEDSANEIDNALFLSELKEILIWHARYSHNPEIKQKSKSIFEKISGSFEVKLVQSLCQNFDRDWLIDEEKYDHAALDQKANEFRNEVAQEFLMKYPNFKYGLQYISDLLNNMEKYFDNFPFPLVFIVELTRLNKEYAINIYNEVVEGQFEDFYRYIEYILLGLAKIDYTNLEQLLDKALQINNETVYISVAHYYWRGIWSEQPTIQDYDLKNLKILLSSNYKEAKKLAIGGLGRLSRKKPRLVLSMLLSVDLEQDVHLADELLSQIDEKHGIDPKSDLTSEDFEALLNKLRDVNQIDKYHIEEFLDYCFKVVPDKVVALLVDRIGISKRVDDNKDYRPLSYSSRKFFSGLSHHSKYKDILRNVRDQIFNDDWQNKFWIPMLYKSISNNFDDIGVEVLLEIFVSKDNKIKIKTEESAYKEIDKVTAILGISEIIKKAPENFVFDRHLFVSKALAIANQYDKETYKEIRNSLAHSTVFRSKHGTHGHPMTEDVDLKRRSAEMLEKVSPSSLEYELYSSLLKHAEYEIKNQLKEDSEMYK